MIIGYINSLIKIREPENDILDQMIFWLIKMEIIIILIVGIIIIVMLVTNKS